MIEHFSDAIAANIRRIRLEHDVTADELADRLRVYGLNWTRPTVSQVETGARRVLSQEIFLIAEALGIEIAALFATEAPIKISSSATVVPDRNGARVVIGNTPGLGREDMVVALREVIGVLGPDLNSELIARAKAKQESELNRYAAHAIGLTPLQAAALALRLWDTDITTERNRRSKSSDRASRGHVTRTLLAEMKAAPTSSSPPTTAPTQSPTESATHSDPPSAPASKSNSTNPTG